MRRAIPAAPLVPLLLARTVATVIAIVGALTGPVSFLAFPGFDAWTSEDLRGAGKLRTFVRVTLPVLFPALLGAGALTLLNSMGSFSAPLFFHLTRFFFT